LINQSINQSINQPSWDTTQVQIFLKFRKYLWKKTIYLSRARRRKVLNYTGFYLSRAERRYLITPGLTSLTLSSRKCWITPGLTFLALSGGRCWITPGLTSLALSGGAELHRVSLLSHRAAKGAELHWSYLSRAERRCWITPGFTSLALSGGRCLITPGLTSLALSGGRCWITPGLCFNSNSLGCEIVIPRWPWKKMNTHTLYQQILLGPPWNLQTIAWRTCIYTPSPPKTTQPLSSYYSFFQMENLKSVTLMTIINSNFTVSTKIKMKRLRYTLFTSLKGHFWLQ
jgi:hypothetical protein